MILSLRGTWKKEKEKKKMKEINVVDILQASFCFCDWESKHIIAYARAMQSVYDIDPVY